MLPHGISRASVTHWTVCGDVVCELEDDIDELEPVNEPVGDRAEADACSHEARDGKLLARHLDAIAHAKSVVGRERHRSRDVVLVA